MKQGQVSTSANQNGKNMHNKLQLHVHAYIVVHAASTQRRKHAQGMADLNNTDNVPASASAARAPPPHTHARAGKRFCHKS